jgi:hypothetical protein
VAGELEPAHAGHVDVADDAGKLVNRTRLQQRVGRGERPRAAAQAPHQAHERGPERLVVVENSDEGWR